MRSAGPESGRRDREPERQNDPNIDPIEAAGSLPVNLLINAPFITVEQAAALGVRRISVGGTLARAAWGAMLSAAEEILDAGTFHCFERLPDVNALFQQ